MMYANLRIQRNKTKESKKKTEILQCVVNVHIYFNCFKRVYIIYKLLFDNIFFFSRDEIKLKKKKKWNNFFMATQSERYYFCLSFFFSFFRWASWAFIFSASWAAADSSDLAGIFVFSVCWWPYILAQTFFSTCFWFSVNWSAVKFSACSGKPTDFITADNFSFIGCGFGLFVVLLVCEMLVISSFLSHFLSLVFDLFFPILPVTQKKKTNIVGNTTNRPMTTNWFVTLHACCETIGWNVKYCGEHEWKGIRTETCQRCWFCHNCWLTVCQFYSISKWNKNHAIIIILPKIIRLKFILITFTVLIIKNNKNYCKLQVNIWIVFWTTA